MTQAGEAMYVAKRLGRNQVCMAEEARQIGTDVELMTFLQPEGQREALQREGVTREQLKETWTVKMIGSLVERGDGAGYRDRLAGEDIP